MKTTPKTTKTPAKAKAPVAPKKEYKVILDMDLKDLMKELAETKDQDRKRTLRRWMRRLGHKGGLTEQRQKAKKEQMAQEEAKARAERTSKE